jgi:hypothetical protein
MKNTKMILGMLLCMSGMATTMHAASIVVNEGNEMRIYERGVAGWQGDLLLIVSPKGIHYTGASFVPWSEIRKINVTRYRSLLNHSFEFEIVTHDNLRVIMDSQTLDVKFNWFYEQIHKYYSTIIEVRTIVGEHYIPRVAE